MNCPCEICLVRPACKNKVVQQGQAEVPYLIVEFLEECPYILEYFGIDRATQKVKHEHEKINKLCELFGAKTDCSVYRFVWLASNIGIYR